MSENDTYSSYASSEPESEETAGTIKYYGYLLLNKWKFLLFFGVLFLLGAFLYANFFITPLYKASTTLYVYRKMDTNTTLTNELNTGAALAKDGLFFVKTNRVAERAVELMDLPETAKPTPAQLTGMISVAPVEDTRIIQVTLTSASQNYVAIYANAVAKASKEVTDDIINSGGKNDFNILNVIDEAKRPAVPYTPNIPKIAIIGLLLGLVVAAIIILLREILSDTFKTPDKLEAITGLEVIGTILTFE
ncbi:MAG: Wzz/FepE/Etk N-terminal domain-containing protein [Clostridia bacterium]